MMMAMVTFVVLTVLIGELAYESGVYNSLVWRQVDQVRARLLARSGLRMALLQLKAAEKAKEKAKSLGLTSDSLTDQIWQTPLVLPPPMPKGLGVIETTALDAFSKSLGLDGVVSVTITGENDRINLNQMVWVKEQKDANGKSVPITPEKKKERLDGTRAAYGQIIQELLEEKKQTDPIFRERHSSLTGEVLAGNILAWIDPTTKIDGDNQDKFQYYSRATPSYSLKDAPMSSESELRMVKGFDDSLTSLITQNFTTQLTGGINVNKASGALLKAVIPELRPGDIELILKRRTDETQGGAFKDAKDFWGYLNTFGDFSAAEKRLQEQGFDILEKETSYQVVVTGKSGAATKIWVAKIGPLPPKETKPTTDNPNNPNGGNSSETTQKNDSNTLNIIYLKAD